jgi:hypothetical protein
VGQVCAHRPTLCSIGPGLPHVARSFSGVCERGGGRNTCSAIQPCESPRRARARAGATITSRSIHPTALHCTHLFNPILPHCIIRIEDRCESVEGRAEEKEEEGSRPNPPVRRGAMARLAVAARAFSAAASGGGVSLVQGASRGIGLEFVSPPHLPLIASPPPSVSSGPSVCVLIRCPLHALGDPVQVRQLLRRSDGGRVVATCRTPGSAAELQKLREEHAPGRLTVLPLDVTDESTIEVGKRTAYPHRCRQQSEESLQSGKLI